MFKRFAFAIFVVFLFFIFTSTAYLQVNSPETSSDQTNTTADSNNANNTTHEDAKTANEAKVKKIRDAYKVVADGSQNLNSWCLLIIAASIATIVSTSYFRPDKKWFRGIYLLFLPGWLFISLSVYHGFSLMRWYMSLVMINIDHIDNALDGIDNDFWWQMIFFQMGMAVFALWLVAFLLFWIFDDKLTSKKN